MAFVGLAIINSMSAEKFSFKNQLWSFAYAMTGAFIVDPKGFVFFIIKLFLKSFSNGPKNKSDNSSIAVAAKGNLLMRFAGVLPKKVRICIEQSVSDMRIDYFDALNEKNQTKATIVVIWFYFGLVWMSLDFLVAKIKGLLLFTPKSD